MTLDKFIRYGLPDGWSWRTLGDICAISDRDHRTPVYVERGVPLISPRDFTENGIDLSNLKQVDVSELTAFVKKCKPEKGDVLYSRIGTIGEARLLDFNFNFVALHSIALVKPIENGLSSKFLLYFLQTPDARAQAKHNIKSVGTPDLGLQRIRNFGVPVPPPKEQRRIVAEIEKQFSRLEEGVTALKRVQANLKRYRAAVLKAACEGKLVPTEAELQKSAGKGQKGFETGGQLLKRILAERRKNWQGRGKYKEPAAPDTANLPCLPVGWTWATVEQLAAPEQNSITDGPFGSNLKTEHYTDDGPRVIRLQNIGDGVYVDEEAHISQAHFERLQKHRVFANDVVIAGFGDAPPRSCIIPEALGPAIVKADCIRFKPHGSILPKYMNVALNSDPVRKRTKGMVHGVGRPRLNLGEIKSIALALPPLAEQTRIVAEVERRLSVIDELESVVSANLQRAGRLRQAVLQKAFTGEL